MKAKKTRRERGITLVALVVTIVVLLILAGITISYVMGDNSVFKKASEAKLQTDIAQWKEKLELAKSPVFIEGLGTFDSDEYFDYIQQLGIINNKNTDVVDNEDGTYDVTTKPGYVFLITLMPIREKPTDAEITYIGQAGKILPIIKKLDVSATATSITGKATVLRLGNGTIKYYYKSKTETNDEYKEITNVSEATGATQSTGITAGESYTIKAVAKNEIGEAEKTAEIIATKIFVENITLNKAKETVTLGKTVNLTATVKPDDATNKNLIWESSNIEVATVSDTGVVTGKTEGTAIITVKATDGSDKEDTCSITVIPPKVEDIVGEFQESNITVEDENGNKVVIPGDFKVVPDTPDNDVDYTYNGDKKPCVQDGIVIEDKEGNQFVWIPVGDIKNKGGTTTTITLGRYTFNTSNGTPTIQQNAINYSSVIKIETYYQELANGSSSTLAKSLADFVNKTQKNGGYYLGRYEASKGLDGNVDVKSNKEAWSGATAAIASKSAKEMYSNKYVESDLANSYAWDTAIVFIQKYSGNSNYANQTRKSTSKLNTGKSGDKVCNIHDMASNCYEWTTEFSTNSSYPTTNRGGCYHYPTMKTSKRSFTSSADYVSFRTLIYVQ